MCCPTLPVKALIKMDLGDYIHVCNLPEDQDIIFVSDSQEVDPILDGVDWSANELDRADYDSVYVIMGEGEYLAVFGMSGIVPNRNNMLDKLA